MQFGSLPAPEMKITDRPADGCTPDRSKYSSFVTAESLTGVLTVRMDPITSQQTEDESPKNESLIEKGKLKRVANSFCVQVPASEFVMNPVRSLFSSFIASENESFSNTNNFSATQDDPFVSGWQDLSSDNLNIMMINDDEDVQRLYRPQQTQPFGKKNQNF